MDNRTTEKLPALGVSGDTGRRRGPLRLRKCSMCGFLHKMNCVTTCFSGSYTIYIILCNYPHNAHRNISKAGLPLVGFAENFKPSWRLDVSRRAFSPTVALWDSLAYTVLSSWYMLGGPKWDHDKWWSEERNRSVLLYY